MSDNDTMMLDELLKDESDRMNAWEIEFLESLNRQRDRQWSESQIAVLEQIWEKVYG